MPTQWQSPPTTTRLPLSTPHPTTNHCTVTFKLNGSPLNHHRHCPHQSHRSERTSRPSCCCKLAVNLSLCETSVNSILIQVRGKKTLILDKSLSGPLGLFCKLSALQVRYCYSLACFESRGIDNPKGSWRRQDILVRGEYCRRCHAEEYRISRTVHRQKCSRYSWYVTGTTWRSPISFCPASIASDGT